jgi:hypothetical protein
MRIDADASGQGRVLGWGLSVMREDDQREAEQITVRPSRHHLRVSHLHRCHRIAGAGPWAPILLFTVVQGHKVPCLWAHAYALVAGRELPISRHFRFDSAELEAYRQLHTDQSLGWMDSEFMFQLSLDQILREVAALAPDHPELLNTIELVDSSQLLRHYINNDIPQLDALLALCGEHYLLHRQLQNIKAFPTLHSD